MGKKVFVSYNWQQGPWVWERLVPCLRSGGAEVLIDRERFRLGLAVFPQMDALQDEAETSLLVLSPAYLASAACAHEMARAIARDPTFAHGSVIPILRESCTLPPEIKAPNPLYTELMDDQQPAPWNQVLAACGADLGSAAPHWLATRDEVRRLLERGQSVNLLVSGHGCRWREMLEQLREEPFHGLNRVDLADLKAASRRGLVQEILHGWGVTVPVPMEPEDLVTLGHVLDSGPPRQLALTQFELVGKRPHFDEHFFSALCYTITVSRKLVLLLASRQPFATLLPPYHQLSTIPFQMVELKGRP